MFQKPPYFHENDILINDRGFLSRKWQKHSNRKRKPKEIQLVTDIDPLWESDKPEEDVPIYKNLEERKVYAGKSLSVVVKNYKETRTKEVVIYVGQYFGICSICPTQMYILHF